jgi:hypothetical protein
VTVSDKCYWNEIKIGCVFKTGPLDLGAFAMNFDAQPCHLLCLGRVVLNHELKKPGCYSFQTFLFFCFIGDHPIDVKAS